MLLIFLCLWIVFNARLTPEVLVVGVVLSTAVYAFCVRFMGYSRESDVKLLKQSLGGIRYVAVVVWETVKANAEVSKVVFARKIEVRPQIVFFKTTLRTPVARVALANSITLTPGTITVAVNDDEFCVHCLNQHMADGINRSSFVRLLGDMEG